MSWQDEARANGYVHAALNSNNDAELARNMRAADKAVDTVDDLISGIGRALTEPTPQAKPQTSSGGGLGLLVAGAALAGGAYLLGKVFGGSDDKQKSTAKTSNNSNQNASSYLKRGNTYLNQHEYEAAIQEFSRAIQISPNYALAYKGRGKCYQALGDHKNAQADFSNAKKLRKKG